MLPKISTTQQLKMKEKKSKIEVQGLEIAVVNQSNNDYISLTDIAKHKDNAQTDDIITYIRATKGAITPSIESAIARAEGDIIELNLLLQDDAEQQRDRDDFMQLMRVCYKKDVIQMMDWADQMGGNSKERQKQFIVYALHMFRQSLMKNYTDDQLTRVSKEENDFLNKFAPFITGKNIQDFSLAFNKAHYHIDRNANARLLFMVLCFNVMRYIHKA